MGLAPAALLPLFRPFHLHQAATSWSTIHRAGPGERRPLGTAAARDRGHQGADKLGGHGEQDMENVFPLSEPVKHVTLRERRFVRQRGGIWAENSLVCPTWFKTLTATSFLYCANI